MTFLLWNGTACEHATQTVPSGEVRECYELMNRLFIIYVFVRLCPCMPAEADITRVQTRVATQIIVCVCLCIEGPFHVVYIFDCMY